ncbi:MAG: hypothetical protein ACP5MV_00710 [Candidatus Parvarchaeum sp.]
MIEYIICCTLQEKVKLRKNLIKYMIKSLFLIGLIIFLIGGISFLGLNIHVISKYINEILSFIPLQQEYTSIIFVVVGLIIMGLSFYSKMGKYYKYY